MNWELLIAAAAVIAGLARYLATTRGVRNRIKSDLEIMERLPDGLSKRRLEQHINEQVDALITSTREKRRDPFGIVLGLILLGLGVWLIALGVTGSNLWFLPAFVLLIFGIAGVSLDAVPRRRDERGRIIAEPTSKTQPDEPGSSS